MSRHAHRDPEPPSGRRSRHRARSDADGEEAGAGSQPARAAGPDPYLAALGLDGVDPYLASLPRQDASSYPTPPREDPVEPASWRVAAAPTPDSVGRIERPAPAEVKRPMPTDWREVLYGEPVEPTPAWTGSGSGGPGPADQGLLEDAERGPITGYGMTDRTDGPGRYGTLGESDGYGGSDSYGGADSYGGSDSNGGRSSEAERYGGADPYDPPGRRDVVAASDLHGGSEYRDTSTYAASSAMSPRSLPAPESPPTPPPAPWPPAAAPTPAPPPSWAPSPRSAAPVAPVAPAPPALPAPRAPTSTRMTTPTSSASAFQAPSASLPAGRQRQAAGGSRSGGADRVTAIPPTAATAGQGRMRLRINPITCAGHGLCAELLPELIDLDDWGYPGPTQGEVPRELEHHAQRAVQACPTLAIILERRTRRNAS